MHTLIDIMNWSRFIIQYHDLYQISYYISNPRLTKGMVTTPLVIFPCRPKTRRKWPKPSRWSIRHPVILMEKIGVPGARVSRQRSVRLPPKILNHHFEKVIACMVLKLTLSVRNVICFFYKPKPDEIPIFWTFLTKFSTLAYVLLEIGYFEVRSCLWRHCDLPDVIRWMFVRILK